VGFEPTISAGERPKTYALDRAATGTGISFDASLVIYINSTNIPPIMFINRIYETQSSVAVACFLPGRAKDLSAPLYMPPV